MSVNKVTIELEAPVFQSVQAIKFGKMINVSALQETHGMIVHVGPVLQIPNHLKTKLHAFVQIKMKFIPLMQILVMFAQKILYPIMVRQIAFVSSIT